MENKSFACWLKQQNILGTTLGSEKLIENARRELNRMLELPENHEPDRGDLDEATIEWRSGKPDYTLANLAYLKGKSMSHEKECFYLKFKLLIAVGNGGFTQNQHITMGYNRS